MNQTIINDNILNILRDMLQIDSNFVEIIKGLITTNYILIFSFFFLLILCLILLIGYLRNHMHIKKLELRIIKIENKEVEK